MDRAGQIRPAIDRYSLDDALEAYRRMEADELSGRAVITPRLTGLALSPRCAPECGRLGAEAIG